MPARRGIDFSNLCKQVISDPELVQFIQRFRVNLPRSLNFNTSLNIFSIQRIDPGSQRWPEDPLIRQSILIYLNLNPPN